MNPEQQSSPPAAEPVAPPTQSLEPVAQPAPAPVQEIPAFQQPVKQHLGTSIMAIVSLVLAFIIAPLGFIFGLVALSQIKKSGQDGKGIAIAGIVISVINILIGLLLIALTVSSYNSVQERARQAEEQSRQRQQQLMQSQQNLEGSRLQNDLGQ